MLLDADSEIQPSMWPAVAVSLAAFLTNFDVTAVVVALPTIATELRLGIAGQAWMMDAYSLAFTAALVVAGGLADGFGRRRAMLGGNLVFAAASVACALAGDGLTLGLARGLQGVGAAFVMTGGIALIAGLYPQAGARSRALACLGVVSGIAMALGPSLGGAISGWLGWRWIFLANLPACLLAALSIPRLVPETRRSAQHSLDYVGMGLLSAALCVLVTTLLHVDGRFRMVAGCVLAALLLAMFVWQQQRRAQPIFDPAIFANRAMVAVALLLNAVSLGYWAILVYLPGFLGTTFGWTVAECGFAMLAATLPMLVVPPIGAKLVIWWGWRRHFSVALAIMAVGNLVFVGALAAPDPGLQSWLVRVAMGVIGLGAALAHPQLSGAVVALVPADHAAMAAAVTVIMRQAGFAIGIAVLGAVLGRSGAVLDYAWVFLLAASVCTAAGLSALLLLPPAPVVRTGAEKQQQVA
ncbi:major facilitator superfamily permease [Bradyrhizobium oligotrophicum S58]|uniref:Major facilitator superfamily permease n=1 Tax=Bradyrhizobium oligotrophicum S58 TaxID=1245469 RepID=M4Z4V5_9BRAD|nr:MFS transporter [Bradyrhizobium oligotrophicum]BAM88042.1 major facilitator superfamily permease [Bradyrhizobium oligotrophicum S58]